ncbi:histidine phosphatase family protein [Lachnoclostridium sp. Marseille-P6806]|uniref:histidine phosphatase family protein n=1 Tax=Lachnoclostridium sp. Marseille-P6806 TaxID=2364793 RepID=UPI001031C37A|nr:histidine phosphatase family protein [Lachnoclostridium sp. Marseille-P6806]
MRLLIIRHADPDYSIDSLTETGWREAELLAERLSKEEISRFYVSPLGRARDTASCTLRKTGREAAVLNWLQEFPPRILRPDVTDGSRRIAWDWLPQDWTARPMFYDAERWCEDPIMREGRVGEAYREVCIGFDALLAEHGYIRDGKYYRAERPNHDTIVLFCHFGLEGVLLSHLANVSPMIFWHSFCAAPSSVTTVYTEERRQGTASFRISAFADISHLYAAGEKPSFAARFRECWTDECRED